MSESSIVVRPLVTPEEYHLQLLLADREFGHPPAPENVQRWQNFLTGLPDFRPEQLRGAFRGETQLGGYMIYERIMRMGAAEISTGCIGIVVAHPEQRKQGVATTLMQDAIQFARSRKHALLLLDGIPKFYYRYGYADVIDMSVVDIDRSAILAQKPGAYTIRPATADDAGDVLALYNRHYSGYTGSFVRSLEQQTYYLQRQRTTLLLAVAQDGTIQGYMALPAGNVVYEVAADNWGALLALLHSHAQELEGDPEKPTSLRYRLPPTSPMMQWLIDELEVPDTSRWEDPSFEWAVRSETPHHRYAGWMARLISLPMLMQAIVPELQARWRRALASWQGEIALSVGEEVSVLHIDGRELRLGDVVSVVGEGVHSVKFSPQVFTQVVFGFRPVELAVNSDPQEIADDVRSALSILFPTGHAWMTRSDSF